MVIAILPSFLLLILAEVGLRWYDAYRMGGSRKASEVHRKSDDATLIYELVPGSETTRDDVRVRINSAGFRDDEFPGQGVSVGRRIVMLGDSVAWGWGVQMDAAFPQLLESQLHKMANEQGETPPAVYNLAVDGYSTEQELRLLELRGLELQPDLVIINYVLNDPDGAGGGLARYYGSHIRLLDLVGRAHDRVQRILSGNSKLNEYHQRVHAAYEEQTGGRFQRLGHISEENDVPILIAVSPVFRFQPGKPYDWQNIHDSIEELCEQNGLLFVDLKRGFLGRDSSELSFDLWHPNEEGHAVIADVLAAYVKDFVWEEQEVRE